MVNPGWQAVYGKSVKLMTWKMTQRSLRLPRRTRHTEEIKSSPANSPARKI